SKGISSVSTLFDGTLGFGSTFLNTWVMAGAKTFDPSKPNVAASLSGSIAFKTLQKTTTASIKNGEQMHQQPPIGGEATKQSVSLTATTTIKTNDVTGLCKWSLNFSPIAKRFALPGVGLGEGKTRSEIWNAGDVFDIGGRSGQTSNGGSILSSWVNN